MTDAAFNTELKTKRVLVECFFGRLKTLFRMARDVYRYDLSNFDVDLDCCIMLTNEHIKCNDLNEFDSHYYQKILVNWQNDFNVKQTKKKRDYGET